MGQDHSILPPMCKSELPKTITGRCRGIIIVAVDGSLTISASGGACRPLCAAQCAVLAIREWTALRYAAFYKPSRLEPEACILQVSPTQWM